MEIHCARRCISAANHPGATRAALRKFRRLPDASCIIGVEARLVVGNRISRNNRAGLYFEEKLGLVVQDLDAAAGAGAEWRAEIFCMPVPIV